MAPIPIDADVATILRRYRRARGLTQEELAERAGLSVGAISYLERGLTRAPQRETLRALAQALALSEEQVAVLGQAARRERSEMAEAITAPTGTNQKAQAIGGTLPRPLTGLLGRDREVAEILATLARERIQLLTLTGPAGVGKTRLAVEVALRARDGWNWAIVYLSLTLVHDPARILPEIAQALGLRDGDRASPRASLVAALADRDLLLVLDNVEQVVSAAPQLLDLLRVCSGLKALVTSRVALNVRGERAFHLAPLALPTDKTFAAPEEVENVPSVTLFLERARAIRPNFALTTAEEARRVAEICVRLDGLPLAIELAAGHIRHMGLVQLLQRLKGDTPLDALASGPQDLPDYQRTMRSAIAWSYDLLSAEEQRVFRILSVFASSATVEGLTALTGLDQQALLTYVDALVDQNLIYLVNRDGSTRYAQLVTLRAYGLERLEAHGEMAFARHHHAEYYATLAQTEGPRIARCDLESLAQIGEEYKNIRAALDWALEVADKEAIWIGLRLAGAMWFWWEVRGLLVEGLHWLERLVVVAPQAEDQGMYKVLADIWSGVMALSYHLGRSERAYEAGECALSLHRRLGDKELLAGALNNQGIVAVGMRRYETAEDYFRESLHLYEELGHPAEECKPLLNLGGLKRDLRHYAEALGLYHQSLRIAECTNEHNQARAILWDFIGEIQILLGEPVNAPAALARAQAIFRKLDAGLGVALCAHDLGRALIALSRLDEAAHELLRAIAMREELGDGTGAARSRIHLARVRLAQADLPGVRELLAEAMHALKRLKHADTLWALVEVSAGLACVCGRYEDSARLYAVTILQRDALWDIIDPQEYERRQRDLATIRVVLGEERSTAIFAPGAAITLDEALNLVPELLGS